MFWKKGIPMLIDRPQRVENCCDGGLVVIVEGFCQRKEESDKL